MSLSKASNIASWLLQIIVAVILFQTLFFKFTGAAESKYIFTTLGLEPLRPETMQRAVCAQDLSGS